MDLLTVALVAVSLPVWAYFIAKWAAFGWCKGIALYNKHHQVEDE